MAGRFFSRVRFLRSLSVAVCLLIVLLLTVVNLRQRQNSMLNQLTSGLEKRKTTEFLGVIYDDYKLIDVNDFYQKRYGASFEPCGNCDVVHVYRRWGGGKIFLFFRGEILLKWSTTSWGI